MRKLNQYQRAKLNKILLITAIVLVIIGAIATGIYVMANNSKKNQINYEDTVTAKNYFTKITIDRETRKVKRDEIDTTLKEEFDIDEAIESLLLTDTTELQNYFANSTFNVEINEKEIVLTNDYQTKTLLVEAEQIEDNFDAIDEIRAMDGLYILKYDTQKRTKAAYEFLKAEIEIKKVEIDKVEYIEPINDESQTVYGEAEAPDDESDNTHGISAMGLNNYKKIIEDNGSASNIVVATIGYGGVIDHTYLKDRISEDYYNYIENSKDVHESIPQGSRALEVIKGATPDNVKILPLVVINDENYTTTASIVQALGYATEVSDVICYEFVNEQNYMIELALQNAFNKDKPVCCVTKLNVKDDKMFPADHATTIAVSSVDKALKTTSYSGSGSFLDFVASSTDVKEIFNTSSTVSKWSGAEYSNAHVVALIALIKTYNKDLKILEVYNIIRDYCQDLGDKGRDNTYGYGFPNFTNIKISDIDKQMPELEASIDDTNWEKVKKMQIKGSDNIRIFGWNVTDSKEVPKEWEKLDNISNTLEVSKDIEKNGEHFIWITDSAGNVSYKSIQVTKVDSIVPQISYTVDDSKKDTEKYVTISISAVDNESGLHDMPYSWDKQNWGTDNTTLKVTENGEYKVYVRDKMENIAEKTIKIKSLPQEGTAEIDSGEIIKEIKVSSKWSGNTNNEVTITFNNNLNIKRRKITEEDVMPEEFRPSQSDETNQNDVNTINNSNTTNNNTTTNETRVTSVEEDESQGYTNVSITVSLEANKKYYIWIEDSNDNVISQGFKIKKTN